MTTPNESSTIDQLLAGLTLFTRFPFWKIKKIPADAFKRAVEMVAISRMVYRRYQWR